MADGDSSGASITGGPFHNTNMMDRDNMPSSNAEIARHKSEEVMAALKKNDGSADQLMGKADNRTNGNAIGGFRGWIKRKLGPGNGESNNKPDKTRGRKSEETGGVDGLRGQSSGIGVQDSSTGASLGDPAPAGDILARDGGKGDGVIR
ncbi:hypothetical protein M409DRAFT_21085 [Zasmidium cellare ATCC 36951]|uniref:Uncharacterized protein n=1 Tax=Zasmidium cellare ATCC 36951 TaxID=1080233 RepID=A0A6A6CPL6_ZASCE|nr:uncharacterized protein M409DRAFT_21085 [Zasmidium cellare ATCC 36951]KAF2169074.1 hypothetical protein M409DRAFT_21085 [Zasmidium cellare ATCC 36951]